jgi:hypothetical protein
MNRLKPILFLTVLVLIGATAGLLAHAKSNQKLGAPGVKTRPQSGSRNLEVVLPTNVPSYKCETRSEADVVLGTLPQDTSFGQALYTGDDGFQALVNVVLMGSSRGSIHDPQICLTAQGWNINNGISRVDTIHLNRPKPYDLPVNHLIALRPMEANGQQVTARGIYVFWFVDAHDYKATQAQWKIQTALDVLTKGELDRWSYISFFSICLPGQEDATFERMKKLIAASVPEFQLVPEIAK